MVESAFNRPTPVQEQQAALKAEPKTPTRIEPRADDLIVLMDPVQPIHGTVTRVTLTDEEVAATRDLQPGEAWAGAATREALNAELKSIARDLQAREEAALAKVEPSHSAQDVIDAARELTEVEASKAIEQAMHARVAEVLERDLELQREKAFQQLDRDENTNEF